MSLEEMYMQISKTRMLDINEVFTTSYENRNNRLYSRETLKIGAIMTGGMKQRAEEQG